MTTVQAHDCARSFDPVPALAGLAGFESRLPDGSARLLDDTEALPGPAILDQADEPPAAPLVPSAYLERPAVDELPHIDREGAAVVLDRYLVRLSRHESVCRMRLGRLSARLLDSRGYHGLGFARLGDYAIERLGISGRELQSAARVWRTIKAIPRLATAYGSGRLNWTKLRTLCEVATQETTEDWIVLAQAMSSRELAEHIKDQNRLKEQHRSGGGACEDSSAEPCDGPRERPPASVSEGEHDDVDMIDGEPRARLRIACPVHMRPLWRELAELASRSSGAVLSGWQALEAVCAEALSGAPLTRRDTTAAGASGNGNPSRDGPARDHIAQGLPMTGGPCETDNDGGSWHYGDWEREFEELRILVEDNTGVDVDVPDLGLAELFDCDSTVLVDGTGRGDGKALEDLSADQLDQALRAVLRSMQNIDWQLGRLLATFARLSLHRHIGYRSMGIYVSERLGICERKARSLARLEGNPANGRDELAAVYRSGRLSWVRALILLPVLDEHNAAAWIERATQVTVRRLQDEVRWAQDMRDRTWELFELEPPALGVTLEFSPAEAERQMRARYSEKLIEQIRQQPAETTTSLWFNGPASVIALFQDTLGAYGDPERPCEGTWRAFQRILLHVKAHWTGVPRHRNPIHERDGWRCRVPACSARRNLQEHHVLYRSRGGDNGRGNRISICAWHHLRGIHTGVVRAYGDAEQTINWHLGPQLRLRDDVYVSA